MKTTFPSFEMSNWFEKYSISILLNCCLAQMLSVCKSSLLLSFHTRSQAEFKVQGCQESKTKYRVTERTTLLLLRAIKSYKAVFFDKVQIYWRNLFKIFVSTKRKVNESTYWNRAYKFAICNVMTCYVKFYEYIAIKYIIGTNWVILTRIFA